MAVPRLHSGYTTWWAFLGAAALALEIIGLGDGWWIAWLLSVAAVEAVALWRRKRGDTASEHVWAFHGGKPARAIMAAFVGAYIAVRFYSVTPGGTAPMILALALGSYLVLHFYSRGSLG